MSGSILDTAFTILYYILYYCIILQLEDNVFVTPHTSPPPTCAHPPSPPTPPACALPPPRLRPPSPPAPSPSLGASAARHPRVTDSVNLRLSGTKRPPAPPTPIQSHRQRKSMAVGDQAPPAPPTPIHQRVGGLRIEPAVIENPLL